MTTLGAPAALHLNPGEIAFAGEGQRVTTLLGSCVALTVWHPQSAQGGMCHAMLPVRARASALAPGCYVDEAVDLLLRAAARRVPVMRMEYKLFGGGCLFGDEGPDGDSIGERNVKRLRELLAARGVKPVAEHCGGRGWRTLVFDLSDGRVRLRHNVPGAQCMEWMV